MGGQPLASQCSGQHRPPILGDYGAQRHWQEITVNILIKVCNRINVDVRCVNDVRGSRSLGLPDGEVETGNNHGADGEPAVVGAALSA